MRLPMYSGTHSTLRLASRIGSRISAHRDEPVVGDTEDERRVAPPALGEPVRDGAGRDEHAALAQPLDDRLSRLCWSTSRPASRTRGRTAPPRPPASAPAARAQPAELEVLSRRSRGRCARCRCPPHGHVVPGDHPVLDLRPRRQVVERPAVAPAHQVRAGQRLRERAVVVATRPRPTRRSSSRPYMASGWTAAATLAGRVHGVVVQMTRASPGRSSSGNRTFSDGSSRST